MWSHIWQNWYHTGTECFASFYQDLSKCFIMEIKPDPLFPRGENPGLGSVSNKQTARIQIPVWLSVRTRTYQRALLSGAWQRATGRGTSTSASQNPEGEESRPSPSPTWIRGAWLLVLELTALAWAPLPVDAVELQRAERTAATGCVRPIVVLTRLAVTSHKGTERRGGRSWLLFIRLRLPWAAGAWLSVGLCCLIFFIYTATNSVQVGSSSFLNEYCSCARDNRIGIVLGTYVWRKNKTRFCFWASSRKENIYSCMNRE